MQNSFLLSTIMKRIASLFLIATLFYNVLGFYLMFVSQKEQTWVSRMEKTPAPQFQVIQMSASLYTFVEDTDFEYVNENVIIKNKSYHVFKKRIQDNVLSLYYLPNEYGDVIGKDLKDLVDNQLFNGNSSKETPTKKFNKSFIKDYVVHNDFEFHFFSKPVFVTIQPSTLREESLHSGHFTSYSPPPDLV